MRRSCTILRDSQPFSDGWKEESYTGTAPSDHFHRPFVMDTEGQQRPIIRYASGSNRENYVIKAEIGEHRILPFEYRHWQKPVEEFGDYGVNRLSDQIIEKIISKVRYEACRDSTGPVTLPHGWRSGPNQILEENNTKYDDERNSPNFYNRLGGNEGYVRKTQPLFKPPEHIKNAKQSNTNANNEASKPPKTSPEDNTLGGLKGESMPGPESKVELNDHYSEPKASPLGITNWRNGTNMSGSNAKVEPKDYYSKPKAALPLLTPGWPNSTNRLSPFIKMDPLDSNSEEEEDEKPTPLMKLDKLKISSDRGGEKPFEYKFGYENPKRNAAVVQFGQISGRETIDSKKANGLRVKLPSRSAEEVESIRSITSGRPVGKYRGAL